MTSKKPVEPSPSMNSLSSFADSIDRLSDEDNNNDSDNKPPCLVVSRRLCIPDKVRVDRCLRLPEYGPAILFFSGGSALRTLSQVLKHYTHNSIHLITPFDSGGSSAELRKAFQMLSVGDLRNRLMALGDDSSALEASNNPHVAALFSHRLTTTADNNDDDDDDAANLEFQQILQGQHALVRRIKLPMRSILISHLRWFANRMPDSFNLRGASIGNLIITGCFLEHDCDIVTAIFWIGKLLGVNGIVRPVTGANLHIRAYYNNNDDCDHNICNGNGNDGAMAQVVEVGQHLLGKGKGRRRKIEKIDLVESLDSSAEAASSCHIDMVSAELVASADVIVFPMGSFFGSLLVNLLPQGVGTAIIQRHCPKVYIPSTGDDPEMYGYTLLECVQQIVNLIRKDDAKEEEDKDHDDAVVDISQILTTVLVDTVHCNYCVEIDKEAIEQLGIAVLDVPLVAEQAAATEDGITQQEQQEGNKATKLDPTKVAEVLLTLGS